MIGNDFLINISSLGQDNSRAAEDFSPMPIFDFKQYLNYQAPKISISLKDDKFLLGQTRIEEGLFFQDVSQIIQGDKNIGD